jgi:hypothetical protein
LAHAQHGNKVDVAGHEVLVALQRCAAYRHNRFFGAKASGLLRAELLVSGDASIEPVGVDFVFDCTN